MRDVTIRPALNGWTVQVGCQQLVFNDKAEMVSALSHYIDEPEKTEKRFFDARKNNTLNHDPSEEPRMPQGALVASNPDTSSLGV